MVVCSNPADAERYPPYPNGQVSNPGDDNPSQIPELYQEGVNPDGTRRVSVRLPSLYAAEWVRDHRPLHQDGRCQCPVVFEPVPNELQNQDMTPDEARLLAMHRRIDCDPPQVPPSEEEIARMRAETGVPELGMRARYNVVTLPAPAPGANLYPANLGPTLYAPDESTVLFGSTNTAAVNPRDVTGFPPPVNVGNVPGYGGQNYGQSMTGPSSSYAASHSGSAHTPYGIQSANQNVGSNQLVPSTGNQGTTTGQPQPRRRRNRPNRNRNRNYNRALRDREAYANEQQAIALAANGNPGAQFIPPVNPQANQQARFAPPGQPPQFGGPPFINPGQPEFGGPIINPVQTQPQSGIIGHEVTEHRSARHNPHLFRAVQHDPLLTPRHNAYNQQNQQRLVTASDHYGNTPAVNRVAQQMQAGANNGRGFPPAPYDDDDDDLFVQQQTHSHAHPQRVVRPQQQQQGNGYYTHAHPVRQAPPTADQEQGPSQFGMDGVSDPRPDRNYKQELSTPTPIPRQLRYNGQNFAPRGRVGGGGRGGGPAGIGRAARIAPPPRAPTPTHAGASTPVFHAGAFARPLNVEAAMDRLAGLASARASEEEEEAAATAAAEEQAVTAPTQTEGARDQVPESGQLRAHSADSRLAAAAPGAAAPAAGAAAGAAFAGLPVGAGPENVAHVPTYRGCRLRRRSQSS
jgi:hypothetical protein